MAAAITPAERTRRFRFMRNPSDATDTQPRSTRPLPEYLLGIGIVVFTITFSLLAIGRHRAVGTWGFDLGIYDQAFWLISRGESFITLRGMNVWAHHVNLIAYVYAPFYWLGAGPEFLVASQAFVLSLTAIPAYRLARRRFINPWIAFLFGAATLSYAPLQWLAWSNFHPEALAVTFLAFAWWYAENREWRAFALACVLAMSTREEVALVVLLLCLRAVFFRAPEVEGSDATPRSSRDWRFPLLMAFFAAGWFFISTKVVIPYFNEGEEPYYVTRFFGRWGTSMGEVIASMVNNPLEVARTLTGPEQRQFFGRLLGGFGFTSLASPFGLLVGSPTVVSTGLASQSWIRDIRFQYTALLTPVLVMASIEGAASIVRRFAKLRIPMLIWVACSSVYGLVVLSPSPVGVNTDVWNGIPEQRAVSQALAQIPGDAPIAASEKIVAQAARRRAVFVLPNPVVPRFYGDDSITETDPNQVDWFVARLADDAPGRTFAGRDRDRAILRALARSGAVRIVSETDGVIVAKRARRITSTDVAELRRRYRLDPEASTTATA